MEACLDFPATKTTCIIQRSHSILMIHSQSHSRLSRDLDARDKAIIPCSFSSFLAPFQMDSLLNDEFWLPPNITWKDIENERGWVSLLFTNRNTLAAWMEAGLLLDLGNFRIGFNSREASIFRSHWPIKTYFSADHDHDFSSRLNIQSLSSSFETIIIPSWSCDQWSSAHHIIIFLQRRVFSQKLNFTLAASTPFRGTPILRIWPSRCSWRPSFYSSKVSSKWGSLGNRILLYGMLSMHVFSWWVREWKERAMPAFGLKAGLAGSFHSLRHQLKSQLRWQHFEFSNFQPFLKLFCSSSLLLNWHWFDQTTCHAQCQYTIALLLIKRCLKVPF